MDHKTIQNKLRLRRSAWVWEHIHNWVLSTNINQLKIYKIFTEEVITLAPEMGCRKVVLKGDALYKFPFSNLCEKDINTRKCWGWMQKYKWKWKKNKGALLVKKYSTKILCPELVFSFSSLYFFFSAFLFCSKHPHIHIYMNNYEFRTLPTPRELIPISHIFQLIMNQQWHFIKRERESGEGPNWYEINLKGWNNYSFFLVVNRSFQFSKAKRRKQKKESSYWNSC